MADKTRIEWSDATWTPIRARDKDTGKVGWHCEHISDGCKHCYAESMNLRLGTGLPFKPGHRKDIEIFLDEKMLTAPLRWKKPRMIFVCSMTDLFADFVETEWIDKMFAVMALCPQHKFQVLTKRHERMREYIEAATADIRDNFWECSIGNMIVLASINMGARYPGNARLELLSNAEHIASHPPEHRHVFHRTAGWPLPNVWLGVSVENQEEADRRIPALLSTPAAIRFVSAEPLLGPIDFTSICTGHYFIDALCGMKYHDAPEGTHAATERCARLDWGIAGGESGPNARPMHPDWARSFRDQCAAASVPFLFKQWGSWQPDGLFPPGKIARGCLMRAGGEMPTVEKHFDAIMNGTFDFSGWQHFSFVGKKRAGRMLDGVEHNGFPAEKD